MIRKRSFTTIKFRFIHLICLLAAMTHTSMKMKLFFTIVIRKITTIKCVFIYVISVFLYVKLNLMYMKIDLMIVKPKITTIKFSLMYMKPDLRGFGSCPELVCHRVVMNICK